MTTLEDVRQLAAELTEEERELLAVELLAGIQPEPGYDDYWNAEIARRVKSVDDGESALIPWDEVRRQLWEGLTPADET